MKPLSVALWLWLLPGLTEAAPARRPPLRVDSEIEYYLPTKTGRAIHTGFVNSVFGVDLLRGHLIIEAGVTMTVASGYINEDPTQHATVVGAGPIIMFRCEPFRIGPFSLLFDVVGALVVYSDNFPPGGDLYNFTWRLGGAFAVRLTERLTLTTGARWMHVSNGQGLTPKNPSYEGVGFPLGLLYRF